MLPFQVRRFEGRGGEEVVLLTRRSSRPYFYPNAFAVSDYRNPGKAPNTIAKVLRSIGMAIVWAETKCRDLDHELAQGGFLSPDDAEELVTFLGLTAEEQETEYARSRQPSPRTRSNVARLENWRPDPRQLGAPSSEIVQTSEVGARIRWVARYAEWHLRRRLHRLEISGKSSETLRANGEAAINRLRSLAPSVSGFIDDDLALEAPDIEIVRLIESMLDPASPANPFKSDFVRHRNYLIWRLLLDTGARRHEVHGARTDDVQYASRRFKIVFSKTIARTVAIKAKTAEAFDDYVMKHWTKLPSGSPARVEGWLFCDENGRRISLRAVNRIFETARSKTKNSPQNISPHSLRRFWNYLFSRQVDEQPADRRLSGDEEAMYRMRIMG